MKFFKVSKYKTKIKFDKFGGTEMGVPFKRGRQNSNFFTNYARHTKFPG